MNPKKMIENLLEEIQKDGKSWRCCKNIKEILLVLSKKDEKMIDK